MTRPAVEAGEKLGYLPGGLEEKVKPYLRPLYDALYELVLAEKFRVGGCTVIVSGHSRDKDCLSYSKRCGKASSGARDCEDI